MPRPVHFKDGLTEFLGQQLYNCALNHDSDTKFRNFCEQQGLSSPSIVDFKVFFTWKVLSAFALLQGCSLNEKAQPEYFHVYYSLLGRMLPPDTVQLQPQHMKWFDQIFATKS